MSTRRTPFQTRPPRTPVVGRINGNGGIDLVPPLPEQTSVFRDVLALSLMLVGATLSVVAVGVLWGLWIALLVLGILLVVAGVLVTIGS